MAQSNKMSLVEAFTSTCVGLLYAYSLNLLIAKAYGFPMTSKYSAILTFWMTVASIARTFVMRRFFEWVPRFWKQLWCDHEFDFLDTQDDVMIQQCHHCQKVVKDRYGF